MFLTSCPHFYSVMHLLGDHCVKPHLILTPTLALLKRNMWVFIWVCYVVSWACDNKSSHPVEVADWLPESAPRLGLSNRGLLVKHDVPVRRITSEAVAWECALGLYTQRMLSLCIRAAWWTNSTLCACVRVKDKTHLCQTHLCRRTPMHAVQHGRRQQVWAAFSSVTVFNIIPLRVSREPEQGPIPALWLQGSPLFFSNNTDIITSLEEPPHLAFSLPLCLTQVSCPHLSSDRYSHPGLNPLHSAAEVAHKRAIHMPIGLWVFKELCLVFFLHSASIHLSKGVIFLWTVATEVVFLLIMWLLNATPAPKAAKSLSHSLAANSKHHCHNPSTTNAS